MTTKVTAGIKRKRKAVTLYLPDQTMSILKKNLISHPPEGKREIVNMYFDPEINKLVFKYKKI